MGRKPSARISYWIRVQVWQMLFCERIGGKEMCLRISILAAAVLFLFAGAASAKVTFPEFDKPAHQYADRLKAQAGSKKINVKDALTQGQAAEVLSKWPTAIARYEEAAGAAPNAANWLALAGAWKSFKPDGPESVLAAYNAYGLATAKEEQLQALRALADLIYDHYSESAKALQDLQNQLKSTTGKVELQNLVNDYRRVGNETLSWLSQTNRVYSELRGLVGKKDGTIDARATMQAPAIFVPSSRYADVSERYAAYCVRFSMVLKADAESYRPFITLSKNGDQDEDAGAAAPTGEAAQQSAKVTYDPKVTNRTLCLYGLEHGQHYTLALAGKFPSGDGHTLGEPLDIGFFVSDRKEQVRFRSTAFVLPKYNDGLIPMRTINATSVAADLIRITDRNLIREIIVGKIGSNIGSRLGDLVSTSSEPLWSGRVEIAKAERNEEVTTNLPVMPLLKARHERLMQGTGAGEGRSQGVRTSLNFGPFIGDMQADRQEWEQLVNKNAYPGIYALVARAVVTGPGTFISGEEAKKEDEQSGLPMEEPQPGGEQEPAAGAAADDAAEAKPKFSTDYPQDRPNWSESGKPVQWFVVTDIGLTYYEGRSKLYVMARSLKTGKPLKNQTIQLVSANNRILDQKDSGPGGVAEFPLALAQGSKGNRLAAIFAQSTDDFAFIDFSRDFFDMSNRGVEGRPPAKDLDAFVYTDRGIYRPEETINALVVVRDAQGRLPDTLPPVTVVLRRPEGSQVASQTVAWDASDIGGKALKINVPANAPLGSLTVEARLGTDGPRLGSAIVQISHFKPDRARLDFNPNSWKFDIGGAKASIRGTATVQYLYGINSANRRDAFVEGATAEAEFLVRRGTTPVKGCYSGYSFGPGDDEFIPAYWRKKIEQGSDASGRLNLDAGLEGFPETRFPLDLNVTLSVFDQSGALARKTEGAIVPISRPLLGVKLGKGTSLAAGEVEFDFLALGADNQPRSGETLRVELMSERDDFVYVDVGGDWKPSPQVGRRQAQEPRAIRTDASALEFGSSTCFQKNASTKYTLPPGRYFVKATDKAGNTATSRFTVGYSSAETKEASPDKADVILEGNGRYRAGSTLKLRVEAPFDGVVAVAISDGDIVGWSEGQTDGSKRAFLSVPVSEAWAGKALYAIVTVFRPGGEGKGPVGPARALGATYFEVERGERHRLTVQFDTDQVMLDPNRQGAPYKLNLLADRLEEDAKAMVFAVDEGILNLTRHKDADPYNYFFGQHALSLGILDSYGRILQAEKSGTDSSGGDVLPLGVLRFGNYTSEESVARAYGPVAVVGGKASFDIYSEDIAKFDGTLHLMGIVWSGNGVGAAIANAVVRSPIVSKLAVPRFLATGDTASIPLTVNNVQGKGGKYEIKISPSAPLKIKSLAGPGEITDSAGSKTIIVSLAAGQKITYDMTVSAPADDFEDTRADVKVDLRGAEPSNVTETSTRLWAVNLRPPLAPATRLLSFRVAPGATQTVNAALFGDMLRKEFVPGSVRAVARISPSFSPAPALASEIARDLPPLSLRALTAAGSVLLAQGDLASSEMELKRIVGEVTALQTRSGNFLDVRTAASSSQDAEPAESPDAGDQDSSSTDGDLVNTASAVEFLGKAVKAGLPVPARSREAGLDFLSGQLRRFLRNTVTDYISNNEPCKSGWLAAAIALSQQGRIEQADVRDIYARCSAPDQPLLQKAAVAEMLQSFGEQGSAQAVLKEIAEIDGEEGSLTGLAEAWAHLVAAKAPRSTTDKLLDRLIGTAKNSPALPLEALAWVFRGAESLASQNTQAKFSVALKPDLALKADAGKNALGFVGTRVMTQADIERGLDIKNTGQAPAIVTITLRGQSATDGPARKKGLAIRRRFFLADGEEASGDRLIVKQNSLLYVVLEGSSPMHDDDADRRDTKTILIDTLPTGFEVLRSNIFVDSPTEKYVNEHEMLDLSSQGTSDLTEARDDRWIALVRPTKIEENDKVASFRIGYSVRATTAGTFALPPAVAEDYDSPELSASSAGARQLIVEKGE